MIQIRKARGPPRFPNVPQKCISDAAYTQEIAELADHNARIRAGTLPTSALVASFQATIVSSKAYPSQEQATAETPSSPEYQTTSLFPRTNIPTAESTLINSENAVRKLIYPGEAFPATSVQVYVLKGSRPPYQAHEGTIYFSQFCAIPESKPQTLERTLLPRDWKHTEEALVIDPLNSIGTRYVNQPLIEKFDLADWYNHIFESPARPISLATGHTERRR